MAGEVRRKPREREKVCCRLGGSPCRYSLPTDRLLRRLIPRSVRCGASIPSGMASNVRIL